MVNNPAGLPTNGNGYEEDMGYRTMTSEDAAILRQNNGIGGHITPSAQTPTSQTNQNNIPQSPPTPQGHHRTSRWVDNHGDDIVLLQIASHFLKLINCFHFRRLHCRLTYLYIIYSLYSLLCTHTLPPFTLSLSHTLSLKLSLSLSVSHLS